MFLAAQKPRKCDAEPTKAMQRKSGTAQSLKEANVADAEGQRADVDPSGVTQSQRWTEGRMQFTERQLLESRRLQKYCRVEFVRYCSQNNT